jgi:hypothetical protein
MRTSRRKQGTIVHPLTEQMETYAREKRLSPSTLARWHAWGDDDQAAFFPLVQALQLGDNQVRDFLDWVEEILLRDGGTVRDLLARPEVTRPLGGNLSRNDKLKAVKTALRAIRYPRLSRLEGDLRAAVKALDLGNRVRVSFPPAFEGDDVTIQLTVRNSEELAEVLSRLRRRLDEGSWQQVFDLLDQV